MKYFKKYLLITSVIFHIGLIVSLYWVIPYYSYAKDAGASWGDSMKDDNFATVLDITEISRNGLKYKGYMVELDGENLYVQGTGEDDISIGEEVKILINKHPFKELKTLTTIVVKK